MDAGPARGYWDNRRDRDRNAGSVLRRGATVTAFDACAIDDDEVPAELRAERLQSASCNDVEAERRLLIRDPGSAEGGKR
jgi:hypothetical protein